MIDELMTLRVDGQHRARRFTDDFLGNAAKQDVNDSRAAVRANDDQIDLCLLGVLRNLDEGVAHPRRADDPLSLSPGRFQLSIERLLGRLLLLDQIILRQRRDMRRTAYPDSSALAVTARNSVDGCGTGGVFVGETTRNA